VAGGEALAGVVSSDSVEDGDAAAVAALVSVVVVGGVAVSAVAVSGVGGGAMPAGTM
jgi:hypothetical protein